MALPLNLRTSFYCLLLTIISGFGGVFFLYFVPGLIVYLNIGISLNNFLLIMLLSILGSSVFFSFTGVQVGLFTVFEIWSLAFFFMICLRNNTDGAKVLLSGFLFLALIFIFFHYYSNGGENLYKNIQKTHEEIEEIIKKQKSNLKTDELVVIDNSLKKLKDYFNRYLPFIISSGLIVTVFINILVAKFLASRKSIEIFKPEFNRWQYPEHLVWIFITAAFLAIFSNEPHKMWGENLVFTLGFLYLIQGCSVMNFIFYAMDFPNWVRILFYILIFLQWYGLVFLFIVGISDIWIEWRKKIVIKNEK